MGLGMIEQVVLWGPPILALLLAFGYYLYWGKENSEQDRQTQTTTSRGEH